MYTINFSKARFVKNCAFQQQEQQQQQQKSIWQPTQWQSNILNVTYYIQTYVRVCRYISKYKGKGMNTNEIEYYYINVDIIRLKSKC